MQQRKDIDSRKTIGGRTSFSTVALVYSIAERWKEAAQTGVLCVESIDDKRASNAFLHHTNDYSFEKYFVVRRGQEFTLDVKFNRPFDEKKDDLKFVFQFGDKPNPPNPLKGSEVRLNLSDEDIKGKWGAKCVSKNGNSIRLSVITPPDCFVGKWKVAVDTLVNGEKNTYRYEHRDPVYVIFNPWCPDDTVYLKGDDSGDQTDKLKEYVLNEYGILYNGTADWFGSKPWNFGQFHDIILEFVIKLLDGRKELKDVSRGDPVLVTRKISQLINGLDEHGGGIIAGNWSGDYTGGIPPYSWKGTPTIIKAYLESNSPVCYGQCWVYSAVTTTFCRTLGIPTRSVTCYESAHDTDNSLTIDTIFTWEMDEPYDKDDSVWNFHVWNEVYFARPDLKEGFGGWQAIDATPQEKSDNGAFCMGPFPLEACKQGEVNLSYDGKFLFAEVNSDVVKWIQFDEFTFEVIEKKTAETGLYILTKKPNMDIEEFITDQYKYPEGSKENKKMYAKAMMTTFSREDVSPVIAKDVEHKLVVGETKLGQPITMELHVKNTSNQKRTILPGKVKVCSQRSTGLTHKTIDIVHFPEIQLGPKAEEKHTMKVDFQTYFPNLTDFCMVSMRYLGKVDETKQYFTGEKKMTLKKPCLEVKGPATTKIGEKFKVELSFKNPLPGITLTDCSLTVDGPAIDSIKLPQGDVKPNATFFVTFDQTPTKKVGKKEVIFSFDSKELIDVDGVLKVDVQK